MRRAKLKKRVVLRRIVKVAPRIPGLQWEMTQTELAEYYVARIGDVKVYVINPALYKGVDTFFLRSTLPPGNGAITLAQASDVRSLKTIAAKHFREWLKRTMLVVASEEAKSCNK